MTVKAIVFDFDGTIIDTEVPDYESWETIFQAHGSSLSLAEWAAYVGGGPDDFDPYRLLAEQIGQPIDRAEIRQQRRTHFSDLVAQQPIMPGVLQWLADADSAGLKVAVASSSDAQWVLGHLERRNLIDRFVSVHTRDDVERVKPDPALYRLPSMHLGLILMKRSPLKIPVTGCLRPKPQVYVASSCRIQSPSILTSLKLMSA